MSVPTSGEEGVEERVVVEVVRGGVPHRVHVWTRRGETMFTFPPTMSETEAAALVGRGLALLKAVDVPTLFREERKGGRIKRLIDTDE